MSHNNFLAITETLSLRPPARTCGTMITAIPLIVGALRQGATCHYQHAGTRELCDENWHYLPGTVDDAYPLVLTGSTYDRYS